MKKILAIFTVLLVSNVYAAEKVVVVPGDAANQVEVSVNFNSSSPQIVYTVPAGKTFVLTNVFGTTGGTLAIDSNISGNSYSNPEARISIGDFSLAGSLDQNYLFETGLTFMSGRNIVLSDTGHKSFSDGTFYGHVTITGYLH